MKKVLVGLVISLGFILSNVSSLSASEFSDGVKLASMKCGDGECGSGKSEASTNKKSPDCKCKNCTCKNCKCKSYWILL